jgi:hypothetical protein
MQSKGEIMPNQDKDRKDDLCRVMDAISDPILEMSDEDILLEVQEEGENPDEIATQVKGVLLESVRKYKQRHLHSAQEEYEQEIARIEKHRDKIPSSVEEQRELLAYIFAQQPQLLTLQNRDFQKFTDADVESLLLDLEALGALDELQKREGETL